ncbi:putative NADPH-dependent thioredoxin reductase A [Hibiscus syriacus]|uniref:NADPH-dependent thioredoxin reductase A n=1 Tax=Hibiscus syriacus TaxID=106335 RepID=A0A6A3BCM8_HIBSY|nr:putative NADPH-dependent thioredoxin reductase A [Hibiscus syriacus]
MSSRMGYTRVPKRCRGSKGLRLNIQCRRFSVQGLRVRFIYLFNQIRRFRSYFRFIFRKMGINANGRYVNGGWRCRRSLVSPNVVPLADTCRLRSSLGRSNSFYSEAISDCLEFIKRCSVSDDDREKPPPVSYVTPTLHSS